MACSEKELGISEEHEGIILLDPDAPTGMSLAKYMGDAVLEIDETLTLPAGVSGTNEAGAGRARFTLWRLGIVCSAAGLIFGLIAASMFLGKPTGSSPTTVAAAGVPLAGSPGEASPPSPASACCLRSWLRLRTTSGPWLSS